MRHRFAESYAGRSGGRSVLASVLVCLSAWLAPTATKAAAAFESVVIVWEAPSACPSEAAVVAAVEESLGQPLSTPRAQWLTLRATITEAAGGTYVAELTAVSPDGERHRRLENADCGKLAEATALLMALAVDPELPLTELEPGQTEPPVAGAPLVSAEDQGASTFPLTSIEVGAVRSERLDKPTVQPRHPPPPETPGPRSNPPAAPAVGPVRPASQGFEVGLSAAGLLDTGTLPGVGPGLDGRATLSWGGPLVLQLGGRWMWTRSESVPSSPESEVSTGFAAGRVLGCVHLPEKRWLGGGCVGSEVGRIRAKGVNVEDPTESSKLWVAPVGQIVAGLPLGTRLRLIATLELAIALNRPWIGVRMGDQAIPVWQPSATAERLMVGGELEL